ncbi:hypothetical protein D3C72_2352260 [compost metagenome]
MPIKTVKISSSFLRSMAPATAEMVRLVNTAKAPEIAMPCPAIPSVTRRSPAIGVSKLTGMNSEATSANTHSDMANTPLQALMWKPSAA